VKEWTSSNTRRIDACRRRRSDSFARANQRTYSLANSLPTAVQRTRAASERSDQTGIVGHLRNCPAEVGGRHQRRERGRRSCGRCTDEVGRPGSGQVTALDDVSTAAPMNAASKCLALHQDMALVQMYAKDELFSLPAWKVLRYLVWHAFGDLKK